TYAFFRPVRRPGSGPDLSVAGCYGGMADPFARRSADGSGWPQAQWLRGHPVPADGSKRPDPVVARLAPLARGPRDQAPQLPWFQLAAAQFRGLLVAVADVCMGHYRNLFRVVGTL